ncbi:hypothetical protein Sru01_63460 [Sphaerisporangium rufum]|uniref:SAF domain-containing protein n=1 Tax=Sphaerisporangium rufum TaxID=1381558 RepID=A0A919R8H8_9ACTN|nr:Flp pilus assembly protein CpaB [Sphaerisporangium rufum]GII81364.1 hypothetical protein Sru01_63460 [Sphaerisporangium rufum]
MPIVLRALRIINRRRRLLAAALAAAALACAGLAIRPVPSREVLAAARDLTPGVLRATDLTMVRLPEQAVPDGALTSRTRATGRILAAPLRRGEPLTNARLLGPGLVDAYGPGTRATPIRVTDAASARLLRTGDVIDVIAAAPRWDDNVEARTATVAEAVRVILPPVTARDTESEPGESGALVVLATTGYQAIRLAQAAAGSRLSITIHGQPH